MARIPVQDLPQVSPSGQGAPTPRTVPVGGFESLTRGAEQLAQSVGGVLDTAVKNHEQWLAGQRKEAQEAEATEGETAWNRYRTERKYGRHPSGKGSSFDAAELAFNGDEDERAEFTGYFNLEGDEAFKAAPAELNAIDERRRAIAAEMVDEQSRTLFLARTAPDVEHDRQQIEAYAGHQLKVANLATFEARKSAALDAVRANPNNLSEVERQKVAVQAAVQQFGLSDEDRKHRLEQWNGEVSVAQVLAQLNHNDWQSAETTLQNRRVEIGEGAAAKLNDQIQKVKGDVAAETKAEAIVDSVVTPVGVDAERALELVDDVPPGRERDEVRQRVHSRLVAFEQLRRRYTEDVTRRAEGTYNQVGWARMPVQLKDKLNEVNPAKYRQLRDESEQRWRRLNTDGAELQRQEREANKQLLNEFMGLSADERAATNLDSFIAKFKEENPELPISRAGASALIPKQRSAVDAVNKGQAVKEAAFLRDAKANAQGIVRTKAAQKEYDAEAALTFDEFVTEHQRPPNAEESAKLIGALRVKKATKPGLLWGYNEEFEYQKRARERRANAGAMVLPTLDFTSDAPPVSTPAAKFEVLGPGGARGMATQAWLDAHPDWRRR